MLITFVGSSHGVPEANRKCSCTLLEVGDRKYFIDLGTPPIDFLRTAGIEVDRINAVFITHKHGDHTNGMIPFCDLLSWYFRKANPEFFVPQMPMVEAMNTWLKSTGTPLREDLVFHEIREGLLFDDGTIRVEAFRTHHCDDSYAFIITAEGKKLVFTGDMKHGDGPTTDFTDIVKEKVDLVVCEAAHFSALQYEEPFRALLPGRVVFNHYAPWNNGNIFDLAEKLKGLVPVAAATDGFRLEL